MSANRIAPIAAVAFLVVSTAMAPAQERRLPVKYRSSTSVYLDGGSADGLAVGDRVSVQSRGETIAELEVVFLSERSASCRVLSEKRPVQAGDVAIVKAKAPAAAQEATPGPGAVVEAPPVATASPTAAAETPWARARGGVSLGLYRFWDNTPTAYGFEQRTGRADLSLWDIAGKPLQFNLRLRSRQDLRHRPPGFSEAPRDERRDRLYELSLLYDPPKGALHVEAGRIGASSIGIGYLDGALAGYRPFGALELGGFYGNRPDLERLKVAPAGRKYGGFLRLAGRSAFAPGPYEGLVAVVREFSGSQVSREYVAYEGRFVKGAFTSFQWAEMDVNRDWRERRAGTLYQLSNLSISGAYRLSSSLQASASYDQRKNYWTADTRPLPDVLFDSFLHQGFRAGFDLSRPDKLGFSGSFGLRQDEKDSAQSYSWMAGVRHPRLSSLHLYLSLDASGFTNPTTDGYLFSARVSKPLRRGQVDFGYGGSIYKIRDRGESRLNQWLRANGRIDIVRHLYFQADLEYDTGDDVKGFRFLGELGYRF